jgi:hypothetical protein
MWLTLGEGRRDFFSLTHHFSLVRRNQDLRVNMRKWKAQSRAWEGLGSSFGSVLDFLSDPGLVTSLICPLGTRLSKWPLPFPFCESRTGGQGPRTQEQVPGLETLSCLLAASVHLRDGRRLDVLGPFFYFFMTLCFHVFGCWVSDAVWHQHLCCCSQGSITAGPGRQVTTALMVAAFISGFHVLFNCIEGHSKALLRSIRQECGSSLL